MNPTRSILIVVVIVASGVLALTPVVPSQRSSDAESKPMPKAQKPEPGSDKAIRAFMRQKLKAMRLVLRGIVTEDYPLIQKNAAAMKKLGTGTEWNIVQGPIYGDHRAAFQRSAGLLENAAKARNTDGAMLVYMQMTLNCIECHRYTRGPDVRRKVFFDGAGRSARTTKLR